MALRRSKGTSRDTQELKKLELRKRKITDFKINSTASGTIPCLSPGRKARDVFRPRQLKKRNHKKQKLVTLDTLACKRQKATLLFCLFARICDRKIAYCSGILLKCHRAKSGCMDGVCRAIAMLCCACCGHRRSHNTLVSALYVVLALAIGQRRGS